MTTPQSLGFIGPNAIADFQRAYAFGQLTIDGILGPQTQTALGTVAARGGRLSDHFTCHEFACHCGGKPGCAGVKCHRALLAGLEALRARYYPGGLTIISGYRCPWENHRVGGATSSQHLLGTAADIPGAISLANMRRMNRFCGLGYNASNNAVVHVDVRQGSTPENPAVWSYDR